MPNSPFYLLCMSSLYQVVHQYVEHTFHSSLLRKLPEFKMCSRTEKYSLTVFESKVTENFSIIFVTNNSF